MCEGFGLICPDEVPIPENQWIAGCSIERRPDNFGMLACFRWLANSSRKHYNANSVYNKDLNFFERLSPSPKPEQIRESLTSVNDRFLPGFNHYPYDSLHGRN